MTKKTLIKGVTAGIASCIIINIIVLYRGCNTSTPAHRKEYKKESEKTKQKLGTLFLHDTLNVIKWKQGKTTTDTVVKFVYLTAPDTCKSYIDTIVLVYDKERELAQKTIETKDSIITNQKTMIAINEKYIEDEIAYSDSVVKSRSFSYLRGLRDGVVLGAAVGFIIPKFIGK